jgi:hypothetical protein
MRIGNGLDFDEYFRFIEENTLSGKNQMLISARIAAKARRQRARERKHQNGTARS